jgi:hypothetical protein
MLILSLIFISLVVLLIFCLSKDTGEHTVYARKGAKRRAAVAFPKVDIDDIDGSDVLSVN